MIKLEFVASNQFFWHKIFLILVLMNENLEFLPQHCFKSFENSDPNFLLIIYINLKNEMFEAFFVL